MRPVKPSIGCQCHREDTLPVGGVIYSIGDRHLFVFLATRCHVRTTASHSILEDTWQCVYIWPQSKGKVQVVQPATDVFNISGKREGAIVIHLFNCLNNALSFHSSFVFCIFSPVRRFVQFNQDRIHLCYPSGKKKALLNQIKENSQEQKCSRDIY